MKARRRDFLAMLAAGAGSALAGCDPGAHLIGQLAGLDDQPDLRPPGTDTIDPIVHHLNRLTWGPGPGDYRRVKAMGVEAFIEEQLEPERIADWRCDWRVASIESVHEPAAEMYEYDPRRLLGDLTRHKLLRAVYSRRQLFEVMVDFWTDHFNIVSEKSDCRWLKAADDRDVIRRHAMGRFRDLVRASATSPAMLIYLDGHDNKVLHPGDRPNENHARELLELHTLGVDGGYDQRDVVEVARSLSGWTYEHRPFQFRAARVAFEPSRHDPGEKRVLGQVIPAGGGADDLERVLDILCGHPATARRVAARLCERFVAQPAPEAAVRAIADAFTASDGDIRRTLRAVFQTEAFDQSRGGLFKRPLRLVVSALRVTGAQAQCGAPTQTRLQQMGHAPFQHPSPDGYPIEQDPWLGGLLFRWRLALDLAAGRLADVRLDPQRLSQQFGGDQALAAHLFGRQPDAEELALIEHSPSMLALCLAGPAFQWH